MKQTRIARTRVLVAAGLTALLTAAASGGVSATTEPPTTEPATSEPATSEPASTEAAVDASAAPDVSAGPGDTSGVLGETTYAFADGEYHWSTDHGIVPRSIGNFEYAESGATFVAANTGVVAVSGADGTMTEVTEGTAVVRPEGDTTIVGPVEETFGAFTTVDVEPGAAPDGGASFTPGAGDRTVTLTSAVIEPGASLDLSSLGADFAYVVVVKGIVDASDGTELIPHGALAWAADAGPVTVAPRSPNVGAEVLVVTVAPAA